MSKPKKPSAKQLDEAALILNHVLNCEAGHEAGRLANVLVRIRDGKAGLEALIYDQRV